MEYEKPKKKRIRSLFWVLSDAKRVTSYDQIKDNASLVVKLFKDVFKVHRADHVFHETFEEACSRLSLSENDIQQRKYFFLISSITYFLIFITLLIYGIYLFGEYVFAGFVVFIFSTLMGIYAYRQSIWYMQTSKRKLGCNFKDWLNFIIKRGKI